MGSETREQHVARLRDLDHIAKHRKLTANEMWEVSRRCAEIGDTDHSASAAKVAIGLESRAERASRATAPKPQVQVTPWVIAQGILMVPVVIIACIVVFVLVLGLAGS